MKKFLNEAKGPNNHHAALSYLLLIYKIVEICNLPFRFAFFFPICLHWGWHSLANPTTNLWEDCNINCEILPFDPSCWPLVKMTFNMFNTALFTWYDFSLDYTLILEAGACMQLIIRSLM